ncbi:MAG: AAA family ATPase [Actinomycetota bacterium]|jgi:ATP-dependent Zn protease|nr:AAA family ATPase [Actinomycetota bacterium]
MDNTSVAARLGGGLVNSLSADVGMARERARRQRLAGLAVVLSLPLSFLWYRILSGAAFNVFALPSLGDDWLYYLLPVALIAALGAAMAMPLMSGRSPHLLFRPEQIDVSFDDVKGLDGIVDEVVKTLNTFLGYALYRDRLGGNPRRGLLFEGAPGTGKTHLAKAMARQAGVPFLFVSATSFQSMWYGATSRKIRSYFKQLRKAALREGGAIGFIEEIDAIATTRGGLDATPLPNGRLAGACSRAGLSPGGMQVSGFGSSEGTGGIVNELLVQLQSFDAPPLRDRSYNQLVGVANAYLPAHRQLAKRKARYSNVLVIAATNRAESLDPALLRPGRFDRRLSFELPAKLARRDLVDHFLSNRSHAAELDDDSRREQLAGQTFGYTPVMIEHLLDEALVIALGNGRDELAWHDIQEARLTGEVGIKNPVDYTELERRTVATHEAGHATVAYLAGTRRLEVLSIVKRKGSLGLLAHGDPEEVYTRTRSEMMRLIDIAMGGMCAEELYFGESGTGPSGDLAGATQIACEVVGSAGMAGSLVSLAAVQEGALNTSNLVGRVLADPYTRPEVDRLLTQAKAGARALLDANRHLVEALRDALLERDELIGEEITAVLVGAGSPVRDGLHIERRSDRRRRNWLAPDS